MLLGKLVTQRALMSFFLTRNKMFASYFPLIFASVCNQNARLQSFKNEDYSFNISTSHVLHILKVRDHLQPPLISPPFLVSVITTVKKSVQSFKNRNEHAQNGRKLQLFPRQFLSGFAWRWTRFFIYY